MDNLRLSKFGTCPRKLAYPQIQNLPQDSEGYNPRFVDGWWHEYEVKHRLALHEVIFETGLFTTCDVTLDDFTGHIDGIIRSNGEYLPEGRFLLEIKSMSTGTFWQWLKNGTKVYYPDYYGQVQGYMAARPNFVRTQNITEYFDNLWLQKIMLGITDVMSNTHKELWEIVDPNKGLPITEIPKQCLLIAKNKDTGQLKWEVIYYDEDYVEDRKILWAEANKAVDFGRLPERPYEEPAKECNYCPFMEECWREEVPKAALLPTFSPDYNLDTAITTYIEGKKMADRGEELMEAVRPTIAQVEAAKWAYGGISVSHSIRKTTPWAELGKVYVPKGVVEESTKETPVMTIRLKEILERTND